VTYCIATFTAVLGVCLCINTRRATLGLAGRAVRNTASSLTLLSVLFALNQLVSIFRSSLHGAGQGKETYNATAFSAVGHIRKVVRTRAFALGFVGFTAYATSFNAVGFRGALCKISRVNI
jgi:hypothetical protein